MVVTMKLSVSYRHVQNDDQRINRKYKAGICHTCHAQQQSFILKYFHYSKQESLIVRGTENDYQICTLSQLNSQN